MGIFSGRKSVAIDSPRHLTLRHARRTVVQQKRALGTLAVGEDIPDPPLKPGEEQLHSYWAPGLDAGLTYTVEVSQTVADPNGRQPLNLKGTQVFTVDAPQFSLPAGSVHSTYPPAGYSEDHRFLPHVVLTDPHLPWERLAAPPAPEDVPERNRVPWLALFAFTEDELRLAPDVLNGSPNIFSSTSIALQKPVKQTDTLAVNMTVSDALAVTDTASPFSTLASNLPDSTKAGRADFVFLPVDLFTSLFSNFDDTGTRKIPSKPDTSFYQYMAHVRNINTMGMAIAGVEDNGIFSIVISNRCGPLDNSKPLTMAVHLVSIEGVENMDFPITQSHVALCSLHSWNYTVLPPGQLNVEEAFTAIGKSLDVLQPPASFIKRFEDQGPSDLLSARIAHRMRDGYNLMKYRTRTGELTMALFRGPLTPNVVNPISELNKCSNSGVDFQILDKELGIMDITYSSAWQLGRSLALADQAFTAALGRLRTVIQQKALKASKIDVVTEASTIAFRTRENLLQSLPGTVQRLSQIQLVDSRLIRAPFRPGGPLKRWHRPRLTNRQFPRLAFNSPGITERYLEHAIKAAQKLAKATDNTIYDETNTPVSADWMIVLAWVMNRMFLAGVPAHYFVTDPSHLEQERLKFFYIDPNWVDAMIDGALSLGNHMGNDKDRAAIKVALNDYIQSKLKLQPHAPQIPTYGFFLRSDLVSQFPDLRVSTLPTPADPPIRAPLLRHEIIADGVMMGLLDRVPNSTDFSGLVFTQPPHQQRFAVANSVSSDSISVTIRRQYTVDSSIRELDSNRHDPLDIPNLPKKSTDSNNIFIWGSAPDSTDLHMLRLPHFPDLQLQLLIDKMGSYSDPNTGQQIKYFDDVAATSALFAMQLNDPVYSLTVNFASPKAEATLASLANLDPRHRGPRILNVLEPSTAHKPGTTQRDQVEDDDDGNSPSPPDHDALTANARYVRPASYQPSRTELAVNLAPHVPSLPIVPLAATTLFSKDSASSPDEGGGGGVNTPAHAPKFTCQAYSPNSDNYANVYSGTKIPEDIIFSVHVTENASSAYRLKEFEIRVQMGIVSPDVANCLLASYEGTGATMLRNLRFNVLAVPLTEQGITYLSLRVLPRAEVGWIDVTRMGSSNASDGNDISFILGLASPNVYDQRVTSIDLATFAIYDGGGGDEVRKDNFSVTLINSNFPAPA